MKGENGIECGSNVEVGRRKVKCGGEKRTGKEDKILHRIKVIKIIERTILEEEK